jgi:acyl-CoA synthetase (AMP-forming)/AMP-acid ligase II/acyl carrier protein
MAKDPALATNAVRNENRSLPIAPLQQIPIEDVRRMETDTAACAGSDTPEPPGCSVDGAEGDEITCTPTQPPASSEPRLNADDPPSTLPALVRAHAVQLPAAIAISAPHRSPLRYDRLQRQICEVVAALNSYGVGRGDRVAIALPNGPEMATTFIAVTAAATAAPLNPAYRESEFDFYLSDLRAKAVIVQVGVDSPARRVAVAKGIEIIELSVLPDADAGCFLLDGPHRGRPDRPGFAGPEDVALVLYTSGTTSRPKVVPLRHRNLLASATCLQRALSLTAADCALNIMPLFHVHGLIGTLLSSLVAGSQVCCAPGFLAPEFLEWIVICRPTWYSAVPTIHQAIVARAALTRGISVGTNLRFVRSSSAPLSPKTMEDLESLFGCPVIEYYGMTESEPITCNPQPPANRKAGSVGIAAASAVAVVDGAGYFLGPHHRGEIVVRGPNVLDGYEGDPAVNESSFLNGWFRTGDEGYFDADGYFFLTGRFKELINRAGEKIAPREIDDVLLEHPAVAQAVSFAIPDERVGEDVGVAIILRDGLQATESELRSFVATRLADFKVPRRVVFVAEFPKTPTGKPQRVGLAEKLGLTATVGTVTEVLTFTPPRSALEQLIAAIWTEVLKLPQVGIQDSFLRLGGDSLLATRIAARIREALRIDLPVAAIFEAPTVEQMAIAIAEAQSHSSRLTELEAIVAELESLSEEQVNRQLSEEP